MTDIQTEKESKSFSPSARIRSFAHAGRGLYVFIKDTHNAWVHIVLSIAAIIAGIYFNISNIEWALIVLASGLVFSAEAFNTAIEIDINLTSPEYHPYARDIKDVAAGAVLIAAAAAILIGVIVFMPRIFELF